MKILTHAAKRLMIAFHEVLIEATADNSGLDQSSKNRCQEIARSLEARPNVERAIMDAEQVLRCRDKNMTFAEFLRSPFSVETTWCRVDVVQLKTRLSPWSSSGSHRSTSGSCHSRSKAGWSVGATIRLGQSVSMAASRAGSQRSGP